MATNKEIATLIAKLSLDSKSFETGIKGAMNPIKNFTNGLQSIGTVAAGVMTAGAVVGLVAGIKSISTEAFNAVRDMQQFEMSITSLSATELVKQSDGMLKYGDAIGQAGNLANETIDYLRKLSITSPFDSATVNRAFQMNAAMGQSIDQAKLTTDAILKLGAGVGMSEAELSGFAVALAQTGATGKITAMDMRQFANNRFGLDKMSGVFEILSKNMGVQIKTNEDFNKAVETGKVNTEDFFKALSEYSNINFSGSVKLMSGTLQGLGSTLKDIKGYALGDMFKPMGDSFAKAFAPIVGGLADFLGEGGFKEFGMRIADWAQPGIKAIAEFGKNITASRLKKTFEEIKNYLDGINDSAILMSASLKATFGETAGGKIADFLEKLKTPLQWISDNKDMLIGAIKGIGAAFAALLVINTIAGFAAALVSPLGAILMLAGALGAAWQTNLGGIRDAITSFWNGTLQPFFASLFGWLGGFTPKVREFTDWIKNAFSDIGGFFSGLGSWVSNAFTSVVDWFKSVPTKITEAIGTWWTGIQTSVQQFKDDFMADIEQFDIKTAIVNLAGKIGEGISEWWNSVKTFVTEFLGKFTGGEGVDPLGGKLYTKFYNMWIKISDAIKTWWTFIKGAIGSFMLKIVGLEGVEGGGEILKTAILDLWKKINEGIGQWWTNVKASVTEFLGNIKTEIESIDLLAAAGKMIDNFKQGIIDTWETFKAWFTGLLGGLFDIQVPDWLTGLFGKGKTQASVSGAENRKNASDKPGEGVDSLGVVDVFGIDPIAGIPQAVIDSFGALNTEIGSLNTSIGTLNSSLGNGEGGLSFLLSGLDLYISTVFTEVLRNFGTFISPDGELGLAITKLAQLFSMEGSTTALKQVLMSIKDYLELDLTTAFTNFGTFISPEGAFGLSVIGLAKSLFDEGSETSLYSAFKKIADYVSGEFTTKMTDFDTLLSTKLKPTYETLAELLYYGNNTVHNAYGAVQGVLESIYEILYKIIERLNGSFTDALVRSLTPMANFEAAARQVAQACSAIASWAGAAIGQLEALIALMHDLQGLETATSYPKQKFSKSEAKALFKGMDTFADGGRVHKGIPSIVGERGPEIFTPKRSGWIIPNDEAFGGHGNKQPINIEIHDIYGDANLEQRIRNGITLGLREAEFHGIGA